MNNKTKRILTKIALIVLIIATLAMVLSSCSSNTGINRDQDAAYWQEKNEDGSFKNKVNVGASTQFIDVILSGIGTFLGWITMIMPANSYILTLFIFAIILEIVMIPFGIKQQKNSIKQAKLRPKEMAIRKKYAGRNDQATQQKVTQEIQELYQKENFNPMGGCLPLLLQLPILIVLYWIVVDPIQYVCHQGRDVVQVIWAYINANPSQFGGAVQSTNGSIEIFSKIQQFTPSAFEGIKDFCDNGDAVYKSIESIYSVKANFNIGPVNLGLTPAFKDFPNVSSWLLLIPVLTFVVYFFSMRITRKFSYQPTQNSDDRQQACSNKMMEYSMPLMSVWMTFMVPAAVGVYWIFKSIVGTLKSFIMSRVMPLPVFTEEDYRAAEKEYAGKQPKKIQKSENAGKVRSLHHIDDDDYDEQGNYIAYSVANDFEEEPETEEPKEQIADNKMTEGATLKDDSDKKKPRGLFGRKNKKD